MWQLFAGPRRYRAARNSPLARSRPSWCENAANMVAIDTRWESLNNNLPNFTDSALCLAHHVAEKLLEGRKACTRRRTPSIKPQLGAIT